MPPAEQTSPAAPGGVWLWGSRVVHPSLHVCTRKHLDISQSRKLSRVSRRRGYICGRNHHEEQLMVQRLCAVPMRASAERGSWGRGDTPSRQMVRPTARRARPETSSPTHPWLAPGCAHRVRRAPSCLSRLPRPVPPVRRAPLLASAAAAALRVRHAALDPFRAGLSRRHASSVQPASSWVRPCSKFPSPSSTFKATFCLPE